MGKTTDKQRKKSYEERNNIQGRTLAREDVQSRDEARRKLRDFAFLESRARDSPLSAATAMLSSTDSLSLSPSVDSRSQCLKHVS